MGVSLGFFRNHEEVFCADGHGELLVWLDAGIGGQAYEEYDDFWVTLDTINDVQAKIAGMASDNNITLSDRGPRDLEQLQWKRDSEFEWGELIRCYASLLAAMRRDVEKNGPLICGWSA